MAVGRISGPLLKDNLLRNGVNLAFETSLLYLDVVNSRVGINTASPLYDLDINGTSKATNLQVGNQASIATFTISGNTISSLNSTINLVPSGLNAVVYQSSLLINSTLSINNSTITSLANNTDLTINTSGTGQLVVNSTVLVNGDLHATGNITADGNITLGNATTDTVTFDAEVNSNIIPAADNTYDLGADPNNGGNAWRSVYAYNLQATNITTGNLVFSTNTISTTPANTDLVLSASGTGKISVPTSNVELDQNLSVGGTLTVTGASNLQNTTVTGQLTQIGNLSAAGNFVTSGNAVVTGNVVSTGYLQLPQVTISGSTISTTTANTNLNLTPNGNGKVVIQDLSFSGDTIQSVTANSNITLTPQGTGGVVVNGTSAVQIPVGTTAQRPNPAANGMIRYNTDLSKYEAYSGGLWLQISGVSDAAGSTYILPEITPGANDHTIYFYANNTLAATIDSTKMYTPQVQTSGLTITADSISATAANNDLNISTTGTGGVVVGNLRIYNSTITNIITDGITTLAESGTDGYVKIAGTNGFVMPSGNTLTQRPIAPVVGMVRFNTDFQYVEVYNGSTWNSVAGTNSGVTQSDAYDIGILSGLIFG
jgi:hypothetical protein